MSGVRPGVCASKCKICGAVRVDQQIGLEPTLEKYVQKMVEVFREVRRVLRSDGTCWINLGDSFSSGMRSYYASDRKYGRARAKDSRPPTPPGLKPKDLCGVPWRVALALQADGWRLRSDIIWHKPNPMPESVKDRPTKAHEYVFMFSKAEKYFWDQGAVREEAVYGINLPHFRGSGSYVNNNSFDNSCSKKAHTAGETRPRTNSRNLRTVWTIPTESFPDAHFATFPQALVEKCIAAGTSEKGCCPECGKPWKRVMEKKAATMNIRVRDSKKGIMQYKTPGFGATKKEIANYGKEEMGSSKTLGWQPTCTCGHENKVPCTVFDPFLGSGTTALVAAKMGRDAVGIELKPEYVQMAKTRIKQAMGMMIDLQCP